MNKFDKKLRKIPCINETHNETHQEWCSTRVHSAACAEANTQYKDILSAHDEAIRTLINDTVVFCSNMGNTNKHWTRGVEDTRRALLAQLTTKEEKQ